MSYGTFLGVVYMTSEGDVFERVLAVIYPAADVVTVAVVLAVLARRVDRLGGPLPVVAAGVVSLAVADSAFAYMTAKGTYGDDPVTDLGWPLGFALLALAAVMPGEDAAEASTPPAVVVVVQRVAAVPAADPRRRGVRRPGVRGRADGPVPRRHRQRWRRSCSSLARC